MGLKVEDLMNGWTLAESRSVLLLFILCDPVNFFFIFAVHVEDSCFDGWGGVASREQWDEVFDRFNYVVGLVGALG